MQQRKAPNDPKDSKKIKQQQEFMLGIRKLKLSNSDKGFLRTYINNSGDINAADEKDGYTPLMCAAETDYRDFHIDELIQSGANINQVNRRGDTALMCALRKGNANSINRHFLLISALLKDDTDLTIKNIAGETAESLATDIDIKNRIIKLAKAQEERRKMLAKRQEEEKNLPILAKELIAAAKEDKISDEWLKNYLDRGGDINAVDIDGNTALILSAQENYHKQVERLIAAGAQIDRVNHEGNSALMYTTYCNDYKISDALLSADADASLMNKVGDTAITLAERNKDSKLVSRLNNKIKASTNLRDKLEDFKRARNNLIKKKPGNAQELCDLSLEAALDNIRFVRDNSNQFSNLNLFKSMLFETAILLTEISLGCDKKDLELLDSTARQLHKTAAKFCYEDSKRIVDNFNNPTITATDEKAVTNNVLDEKMVTKNNNPSPHISLSITSENNFSKGNVTVTKKSDSELPKPSSSSLSTSCVVASATQ